MNQPLSIRNQRCPNSLCSSRAAAGRDRRLRAVILHGQKRKRFKCAACGITWSASSRKVEWRGLRSSEEKIRAAEKLLADGLSVRKIAERVGISPSTAQQWKKRFGSLTCE